jgi:hypothetical protein
MPLLSYTCSIKFCGSVWACDIDRGCLRTGCLGEYLDRRGMKRQEVGENCVVRGFITYTLHQV